MKELLERWSELEPERCIRNTASTAHHYGCTGPYMVLIDSKFYCLEYGLDTRCMQAIIQGAVQQAIEARGWGFSCGYNTQFKHYWGFVVATHCDHTEDSQKSTVDALLSAYLKMLRAEVTK